MANGQLASRKQIARINEMVAAIARGDDGYDAARAQRMIDDRTREAQQNFDTLRKRQAWRLYDTHKAGDILGLTFEQYLDGTDAVEPIPFIPTFPEEWNWLFGSGEESVILRDARLYEKLRLKEYCRRFGIVFEDDDDAFESYEKNTPEVTGVHWMKCQAGHRNHKRAPAECRSTFETYEVGGDIIDGVSVYAQLDGVIRNHGMHLPGSVLRDVRKNVAYLGLIGDGPGLSWYGDGRANPRRGSLSRGVIQSSPL